MLRRFSRSRPSRVSLEEQLEIFASCGITLSDGITIDHLLRSATREDYERLHYSLLFDVMCGEEDIDNRPRRISPNLYGLDTECIVDHGDYVRAIQPLVDIAQGELPLIDLRDHVDLENKTAWIEFELDGKPHHIDAEINDDWIDTDVLAHIAILLSRRSRTLRLALPKKGEDQILRIWCTTKDQISRLYKKTGLRFVSV